MTTVLARDINITRLAGGGRTGGPCARAIARVDARGARNESPDCLPAHHEDMVTEVATPPDPTRARSAPARDDHGSSTLRRRRCNTFCCSPGATPGAPDDCAAPEK